MDFYLTAFPFVGSRLEVITANGVRYEGQLSNADASTEQITLIKGWLAAQGWWRLR